MQKIKILKTKFRKFKLRIQLALAIHPFDDEYSKYGHAIRVFFHSHSNIFRNISPDPPPGPSIFQVFRGPSIKFQIVRRLCVLNIFLLSSAVNCDNTQYFIELIYKTIMCEANKNYYCPKTNGFKIEGKVALN